MVSTGGSGVPSLVVSVGSCVVISLELGLVLVVSGGSEISFHSEKLVSVFSFIFTSTCDFAYLHTRNISFTIASTIAFGRRFIILLVIKLLKSIIEITFLTVCYFHAYSPMTRGRRTENSC